MGERGREGGREGRRERGRKERKGNRIDGKKELHACTVSEFTYCIHTVSITLYTVSNMRVI